MKLVTLAWDRGYKGWVQRKLFFEKEQLLEKEICGLNVERWTSLTFDDPNDKAGNLEATEECPERDART